MSRTMVVCNKCSAIFKSPIAFGNRRAFETSNLTGNIVTCPICKNPVPVNKENMIFEE